MTCKLYSKAETAARVAVIQALHDNVDQATLGKLWDAYLGLRDVSENHTHEDDITITTSKPLTLSALSKLTSGKIICLSLIHI